MGDNPALRDLVDEARKLAPQERIDLAEAIMATIEPDADLHRQWAEKADDRYQAVKRGELSVVEFSEAIE